MTYQNEMFNQRFLTQTDSRWKNEKMALSTETIGGYGCLITALTNIINLMTGKGMTVKDSLDIIRVKKLFAGLRDPGIPAEQYSFLLTDDFLREFGLKRVEVRDIDDGLHYCRVNVRTAKGGWMGHYTNVFSINDRTMIFDVYDGTFTNISRQALTNIWKVVKI